ncbi:MAG: hypothetical protein A2Y62_12350 [Candidatus Fischerbacteria bacterium RBG_13_37_8]|uniref:Uncharacterized protein n=1 Tax=Candidatus Fischerbacteria bacterium RBG_13_37_8 TaxID=1817863 RepID=A0A1F5VQC5_9BACT|nr:MAG: hypothetical protein A2Y62_12350 [Candidatus Fischerbacteria bacterium RBG_13_37_8]
MKNTEEDIKLKVIMSWLKRLGFEENEMEFEKTFTIRLGKLSAKICAEEQIKIHRRLDILVKRNGENLFVIEVKTDGKKLNDNDKEQAIIYARLVNPIASIAMVTNGKESKIYRTGDKTELEQNKEAILGYKINTDDIQRIYAEALENFIGYSAENVKTFCDAQIKDNMKTLLGTSEELNKKYIPELYVPSKKLAKRIDEFLVSDKPVFAIIGESGSGKTCSMCGFAINLLKDNPVLFYRANSLYEGITKSIANDFNWVFSSYYDDIQLLKRINKIFKDRKIVIFIDAVDDWDSANKIAMLGNFASKINNLNFKLIISCKSSQWDMFLCDKGIPTPLSEEIYLSSKYYLIEPFDDEEFFTMIKKYQQVYNYYGTFGEDVLKECRKLPFLLKLFFGVARIKKIPHLNFSIKEFYDEYYKTIIDRLPNRDKEYAERILKLLARILYENNLNSIKEELLRAEGHIPNNEDIRHSLFECNILEKHKIDSEYYIGFYFQKYREKQIIIDAPIRANAEAYLDLYIKLNIGSEFCILRNMIYKTIEHELPEALEKLASLHFC